jgi:hypothetical protein
MFAGGEVRNAAFEKWYQRLTESDNASDDDKTAIQPSINYIQESMQEL